VGSSKNLGRAIFRKMPEAGLKIAQKGLKNTFFVKILPRHLVWLGSGYGISDSGEGLNPQTPPPKLMYARACGTALPHTITKKRIAVIQLDMFCKCI